MLSLAKLARGSEGYYLEAVAQGAEDYYVGRRQVPGYWTGSGAELLGLDGDVTAGALRAVLGGRTPDGTVLGALNRTVPGFDLTFSVPKSVSVLAALRPDLSEQIVDACEIVVARTLAWLEENACASRRGRNGVEHVDGDGFVAAAFRHRTSRAGDPQLHWHVLVANTTLGPDGRWRTLDGTRVYPALRTAGFLFEAELRQQLTQRLGVDWRPARHGIADIDGVPAGLLRLFSKRRSQIEDRLAINGHSSGKAAQIAALTTRARKAPAEPDLTLRDRWRIEAAAFGFDTRELDMVLDRPRPAVELDAVVAKLLGPTGLTHHSSTFTRFDALRELASEATIGANIDNIEQLASQLLDDPETVDLGASIRSGEDVALRSGRRLGLATHRYSTRELITVESRVLDLAAEPGRRRRPRVNPVTADGVLYRHPSVSDEQRTAIRRLVTRGSLVDALVAAAGSGKTYSLELARQAWEQGGYRVIGAALAARAAAELEDQAHIPSRTITKLQLDLDDGIERLDERTVLVVDEAAMVGTRALANLFDAAHAGGARLVLVGDPKQLQAIEAGGVLRALADRGMAVGLSANRRQQIRWERHALADLRAGEVGRFLAEYQQHGRVHVSDTAEGAKHQLVDYWATQLPYDVDVVILALRRPDVAALNRLARTEMLARGRLGPDAATVGDREYRMGDRVVCLKNRRANGLLNGLRGQVTSIDADARSIVIRLRDGTELGAVPTRYLEAGHVDHGYAMTVHKAQGLTADQALVLVTDDLYHEAGYTALSRARFDTHIYAAADHFADDPNIDLSHAAQTSPEASLTAILDRWLTRGKPDQLAIEMGRERW